MKAVNFFIYSFILITAFSISAISQTVSSPLIVINTEAFKDKQNGIKKFIEAIEKLEIEFKPKFDELNLKAEKSQKLFKEIKTFTDNPYINYGGESYQPLQNKIEEYKKLNAELKENTDQLKSAYAKRRSEVLPQIRIKIYDAIKQFAKENNYEVILDLAELDKISPYVSLGENFLNVTDKFIEFYNRNFSVNNQK